MIKITHKTIISNQNLKNHKKILFCNFKSFDLQYNQSAIALL